MQQIQFDTVTIDGRVEEGRLVDGHGDRQILRTQHENRPDFVLHGDGTVDLIVANKADCVLDGFGDGGVVLD